MRSHREALPYFSPFFFLKPAENRILFQRDLSSKGGNAQCQETKMNSRTQKANHKNAKKRAETLAYTQKTLIPVAFSVLLLYFCLSGNVVSEPAQRSCVSDMLCCCLSAGFRRANVHRRQGVELRYIMAGALRGIAFLIVVHTFCQ